MAGQAVREGVCASRNALRRCWCDVPVNAVKTYGVSRGMAVLVLHIGRR